MARHRPWRVKPSTRSKFFTDSSAAIHATLCVACHQGLSREDLDRLAWWCAKCLGVTEALQRFNHAAEEAKARWFEAHPICRKCGARLSEERLTQGHRQCLDCRL